MARFKCKNCGNVFRENVMSTQWGSPSARCPKCGSTWTEYLGPDSEVWVPSCKWPVVEFKDRLQRSYSDYVAYRQ